MTTWTTTKRSTNWAITTICCVFGVRTQLTILMRDSSFPLSHAVCSSIRTRTQTPKSVASCAIHYTIELIVVPIYFNNAESIGFEPMHPFRDDRLAICSFNHSGNSLLFLLCYRGWTRTTTNSSKGSCPAIRRPDNNVGEEGFEPPMSKDHRFTVCWATVAQLSQIRKRRRWFSGHLLLRLALLMVVQTPMII